MKKLLLGSVAASVHLLFAAGAMAASALGGEDRLNLGGEVNLVVALGRG